MNHLPLLVALNLLNTFVFWLMWKGFSLDSDLELLMLALPYQFAAILGSFGAYFVRNSSFVQKLVNFRNFPEDLDRARFAYLTAITGAYAFTTTNLIAALVLYLISGTIDVAVAGYAT